ncbi:MAG: hypothetical protein ACREN7_06930 [Candidatus Dormibacteria bacterium]
MHPGLLQPPPGLRQLLARLGRLAGSWPGSRGQGMVEYSLVLVLVVLVVLAILAILGGHVGDLYSNVNNGLDQAAG